MNASGSTRTAGNAGSYAALLEQAHKEGLRSLATDVLSFPGEYNGHQAVVRVSVIFPSGAFSALGEASSNGNSVPSELLELAETRAKIRAFSDALGIKPSENGASSRKPSLAGVSRNSRKSSGSKENAARGNSYSLTSAQRRFLFRLVVEQGIDAKQANDTICELAGVEHLGDISKRQASELIDELQRRSLLGNRVPGEEG